MADDMGHLAREIVASYEARISSVEQIIEAIHERLEGFKSQSQEVRAQLREALAKAASLRRRDFDAMMKGILARQEECEKRVKETVRGYLQEQRALAASLKEALVRVETDRIGTVKELLAEIAARRLEREREVKALLADFQREQGEMISALRGLLTNGGSIGIKDFKAAMQAIQSRHRAGTKRKEGSMVVHNEGRHP